MAGTNGNSIEIGQSEQVWYDVVNRKRMRFIHKKYSFNYSKEMVQKRLTLGITTAHSDASETKV